MRRAVSLIQDSPARRRISPLIATGLAAAGLLIGFAVGFRLADGLNREEHERLRAELARLRSGGEATPGAGAAAPSGQPPAAADELNIPTLTGEQLRAAIERADSAPADADLQRTSGQALYLYAMQKGNAEILPEVARILERAYQLDPGNARLAVFAGNAHFLVARQIGDTARLRRARRFYERALEVDPADTDTRTSLGLTYFFDTPSDPERAAREYARALETNSRAEAPLQGLVAALVAAGRFDEAERRLEELATLNANNPELQNLRAQLEQKRNAAKEAP
jgi:tetratricopeptide (TPR) repeat protein